MKKDTHPLSFLEVAFRDYKVGAWSPSSQHLAKKVLTYVQPDRKIIVEFGPGGGAVTRALLKKLAPDGILIVVEQNADFASELRNIDDRRLRVVEQNAEEVVKKWKEYNIPKADIMLSSIPFSFLKPKERETFITSVHAHLKDGGMFIVFHQYRPIARKILETVFKNAVTSYEWRNFLPCFVFVAEKK